ncbi:MAG: hypothetical protein ACRD50_11080 [Candidatus Acidiferrales bacterium]
MKILVTFALEPEFAPWRAMRNFRQAPGSANYETEIGDAQVRVVLTGAGPAAAQKSIARAIESGADVCISSGLAGSLRHELRIGEVLAARTVRELKTNRIAESDPILLTAALQAGAREVSSFCTSDEVVLNADGKQRLGRTSDAVEMESFAILRAAAERSIPAIAMRAISDLASEDMPIDFNRVFDGEGKLDSARLAMHVARAPHRLPAMIRLGRASRSAAKNLAICLEALVTSLEANRSALHPIREAVTA